MKRLHPLFLSFLTLVSACGLPDKEPEDLATGASQVRETAPRRTLSSCRITGIALDAKDLAWVGTDRLLATYDGENTRIFSVEAREDRLPSGQISCLFSDHAETVWIGTAQGLCTYSRYGSFRHYPDSEGQPVPVTQLTETSDNVLLIQSGASYYRLNPDGVLLPIPSLQQESTRSKMVPDEDGGLWILTQELAVHFNRTFEETGRFPAAAGAASFTDNLDAVRVREKLWVLQGRALQSYDLRDGRQDPAFLLPEDYPIDFIFYEGRYLLLKSLRYGLQVFDPETRSFVEADLSFIPEEPSRTDISCLAVDRLGNLWIGYEHYGLTCVSGMQWRMDLLNSGPLHRITRGKTINSLRRDGAGNIWGSVDHQVFCYQASDQAVKRYEVRDLLGPDSRIVWVETDGKDHLWLVGYQNVGVASLSGGKPKMKHIRSLSFRPGQFLARDGDCFFAADTPYLYRYCQDGTLDSLQVDAATLPHYNRNARFLPIGERELLLLCDGLACALVRPGMGTTEPFIVQNETFAAEDRITDAILDGQTVWFSLGRGGLFSLDLRTGNIVEEPALSGLNIAGLLKYSDNRLIFGSGYGVFYYDLQDKTLRNYDLYLEGEAITAYSPGVVLKDANTVIMGTNFGCVTVPADLPMQATPHHISVHQMITHDAKGARAVMLPADDSHVTLGYRQNSFEILYGGVSYDRQPIIIEYKLEGYNPRWMTSTQTMSAVYSRVPPGKYTFKLREVQPFTSNILDEKELQITLRAAPWASLPARLLYLLLGLGLVWAFIAFRVRVREHKLKLSLAEERSELERRTNQMNMNFFANVAHEFRNPLTIISGPLGSLLKDPSISPEAHKKLIAISASSNAMLRLIDQMLDFNQLEMDVLRLCVGEHDVPYEISRQAEIFEESASPRGIRLACRGLDEPLVCLVDMDKVEKILNNLFTNALKHTPDGGEISITFDDISGEEATRDFAGEKLDFSRYFQVDITNNGRQIPEEKLGNVFKRYFQSDETSVNHDYGWGRGIGLYYVQQLVRVHHGSIRVFNLPDGVCFRFVIPTDREAYADAGREDARVHRALQVDVPKQEPADREAPDGEDDRPVLLIVDDDIQVGHYIRSLFEDQYRVVNRYSAEAALKDIETVGPDLVISDVVMGKMSGFEFCRTLKSDVAYSHIPIILLTAKTDVEDSVSGLESGANAYVTKPFSAEYLTALVSSLLRNMENVRSYLNAHTDASLEEGALGEQDSRFMSELYNLMEKHLSEADLNVPSVCAELRISRSKFNYKLKGLTGSSPGAFFRNYKLNRAAKLLKEGKYNVSEIADMMGFASVSNFSASFKKMFGVAPRDYGAR